MNRQASRKAIQDLENLIRREHSNSTCLFPGCVRRAIRSHIIARKTLNIIAEKGHVLTWLPVTAWDMQRSINAGQPLEELFESPTLVGISANKVTEPLFCRDHDNTIFAPLEDKEFSFQPEQVALLAFRALSSMIFSTSATEAIFTTGAKQLSYQQSLSTVEASRKLQRFQTTSLVLQVRQLYTQLLSTHDYNQLEWSKYWVNIQPCIAATYAFIPVEDGDAKAIIDGEQAVTVEDAVCFSFLPNKPMNNSVCVISWLRGSQRAQRFMTWRKIEELSEQELQDLFLFFAFESPTLFISPTWWLSLSDEKRQEYTRVRVEAGKRHDELG